MAWEIYSDSENPCNKFPRVRIGFSSTPLTILIISSPITTIQTILSLFTIVVETVLSADKFLFPAI